MVEGTARDFSTYPPKPEESIYPDERPKFGFAGTEQKKALESQIDDLQGRLAELAADGVASEDLETELMVERSEIQNELQERQLELDVFLQEHDNAGAFKMKRFSEGFNVLFEEGKLNINENGILELDSSEENRRMAVINVGELARFNKEGGGHKSGDKILSEAVHSIEEQVIKYLQEIGKQDVPYSIYRYSGNEYMVDVQDISKEEMRLLAVNISHERPTIEGVEDPAPLAVAQTGFSEMVSVYNESWQRFAKQEEEKGVLQRPNDKTIQRDAYGIMKDIANYGLDIEKFASRASRVQDKISQLGVEGAKPFFDNYMKKMFADSPMENIDDFVGKSDLEVYDMAFEWASKMLGQAEELDGMLDEIAETFARRILDRRHVVELPEKFIYASGEEIPLANIPQQTRGQVELAQAQDVEDTAEQAFKKDKINPAIKHERNMAKLENRMVKARRDQGTGLLERGVYYGELAEALSADKETSVVFVDMGFLKYFDQAGGREVGNDALKLAADLMEQAVEETGLDATVYRYGGDEFTVRIDGGQDAVAKFNAKLYELTKGAGAVPAGKAGHERGYYPTPLEFNYGVADTARLDEAMKQLEEAGYLKEGDVDNPVVRADIMTTIADKMIETQKAVRRFDLLIRQLEDNRYWSDDGDDDYKKHVDKLIEFSDKGIFGERGGRDALMSWAQARRGGADANEVRQEIMEWVGEQIADTRKESGEKQSIEDMIIEQMVRDAYRSQIEESAVKIRLTKERDQKAVDDQEKAEKARREIENL